MFIHADCSFRVGAQHLRSGLPCQDYAITKTFPHSAVAIVSDGCSTGDQTDIGARVIACSKLQSLRGRGIFRDLMTMSRITLGLSPRDLLATCLHLEATETVVVARIHGDGVVAFLGRDGSLQMHRMEWDGNRPAYPIYAEDGYAEFIASHGGDDSNAFSVTTVTAQTVGEKVTKFRTDQVADGFQIYDRADLRAAAIFSDGVCQIEGFDWRDAVQELMAFKTTAGNFVKRRLNAVLREADRACAEPIDDIAMAAIVWEDD